jgi:large subunit ribosomal protein L27
MAHKKAGGSSRNGRDTAGKRLGVKRSDGQFVLAGNIIVTQRGTKMRAGRNVLVGRTHSLHAAVDGHVRFERKAEGRVHVSVDPPKNALAAAAE